MFKRLQSKIMKIQKLFLIVRLPKPHQTPVGETIVTLVRFWLGRFDEARANFEKAVGANNPNIPMARWKLAGAYVRERRTAEALELLVPLEPEFPQQYEVVLGLGLSYYVEGELERAGEYLARAMTIRAPRTSLLNALADIYLQLGEPEKARPLLERSLKLDGSQDAIQEKLSALPTG